MSAPAVRIEPVPSTRGYSTAWWGMVVLITTEATVFIALLAAYYFVRAGSSRWPPAGISPPELHRSVMFSIILIASSIPIFWMEHALFRGHMRQVAVSLAVAFLMGDGRYGIFEILKHVAPGILCDIIIPPLTRGGRNPGPVVWTLVGGLIGAGRFATIFGVTLTVQAPAVAYAMLIPGLTIHTTFGALSGYVSYHLVKAILKVREVRSGSASPAGAPTAPPEAGPDAMLTKGTHP